MSQTRTAGRKLILLVTLSIVATSAVAGSAAQPATAGGTDLASVGSDPVGTGDDSLVGETVNLYVSSEGESEKVFSFDVTDDERIENLERGVRDDATMAMRTDLSTFQRIAHAPNPQRKFQTAVERGGVEIRSADAPSDAEYDAFAGVSELIESLDLF